ncbi:MAG: hypothetical protein K6L75_08095 [Cellvibrionaceae bacterium]
MKLHLTDLDELVQKVRNAHPKNYLNEAVTSYRAGAYRAALITTWIAVCVDIIEKIRELSSSGDGAAKVLEDRMNNISPAEPATMLAFERELLDIACNQLEFLSVIEKAHLERLKEDRNICAHPTFSTDGSQFSPLAETALSYIVQAANYLLIHPPMKGKVVVERLYDLVNELSFPEDDEKAFVVLSSDNNLGRVRSSSVRNLVIVLLKRIFRDDDGISPELLGRIASALGAISRLYPDVYREVMESKLSQMLSEATDKHLKRSIPFLVRRTQEWNRIEQAVKVRIEGLVTSMTVDELISYKVVSLAEIIQQLNNTLQEKMESIGAKDKVKLLSAEASPIFKAHAIELFVNALNFDSAEFLGKKIILPLSMHFSSDEVEQILSGACENTGAHGYNQILPAGSIDSFFAEFYSATKEFDPTYKETWVGFIERIKDKRISYDSLNTSMIADGLIKPDEIVPDHQEDEWPDDIPF